MPELVDCGAAVDGVRRERRHIDDRPRVHMARAVAVQPGGAVRPHTPTAGI